MLSHISIQALFRRYWPVVLCWFVMMIGNAVAGYATERGWRVITHDLTMTIVIGFYMAQFALAAIIGGLVGRTWLSGWLVSVFLAIVSVFVVRWSVGVERWLAKDLIGLCGFFPLLMLGSCAPLIVMRSIRGWSLTTREKIEIPKATANVEDLFLLSLVVASCIAFEKIFEEFSPMGGGIAQAFFFFTLFSTYSLILVLPVTAVTFRSRTWKQRWIGWLALVVFAFIACWVTCIILTYANGMALQFWSDLPLVCIGLSTSTVTMALGLWSLLSCGFRLTYFEKAATSAPAAFDSVDIDEIPQANPARQQARLLSAIVIACAVVASLVPYFANYERTAFLRSVQSPDKTLAPVDKLRIRGNTIIGATFLPTLNDLEIGRYSQNENVLERLSLSGTQITDAAIESLVNFPALQHLDLSNTAITNDGLRKLTKLKQLSSLSVANTKANLATALEVASALHVMELDVSGLGVTDDQLTDNLQLGSIRAINFSNNPISDVGLANLLLSTTTLSKLDVSDTSIDGSGFTSGTCPARVILDGTKITDANLMAMLNLPTLRGISIRRTEITSSVLPAIAKRNIGLMLGEGKISQQDLINLGPANLAFLCLNHKKFTGECTNITTNFLDLSYSSVTDSILITRLMTQHRQYLNLSHTDVSDGSFYFNCSEVDLRNTRVSPSLLKHSGVQRILVSNDQFTAAQLAALPMATVHIDEDSSFPKW